MSSTLSNTESSIDSRPTSVKYPPTDIDGDPIKWAGNPAYLEGALHECGLYFERTGAFEALIRDGAVPLSNGRLAVDSIPAIQFVSGVVGDAHAYSFLKPCPQTPGRIDDYNALRPPGEAFIPDTSITPVNAQAFTVSKYAVRAEDHQFCLSMLNIIEDSDLAQSFAEKSGGSGRRLVTLLKEYAATATSQDKALVASELVKFVAAGHPGELTHESFNAHFKLYKRLVRNKPPSTRPSDEETSESLRNIIFKDPSVRDLFELKVAIKDPGSNIDELVTLIRSILRSRKVAQQLDELTTSSSSAPFTALTAKQIHDLGKVPTELLSPTAARSLVIARQQQDALLAVGRDPAKSSGSKGKGSRGKGGSNLGRSGRGGRGGQQPAADKPEVPRDAEGRILMWVRGMGLCRCGKEHLFRDCPDRDQDKPEQQPARKALAVEHSDDFSDEEIVIENDADLTAQLAAFFSSTSSGSSIPLQSAMVAKKSSDSHTVLPPHIDLNDAQSRGLDLFYDDPLGQRSVRALPNSSNESRSYWAVNVGPFPGIYFGTWSRISPYVTGYSGAPGSTTHKKFEKERDALSHCREHSGLSLSHYTLVDSQGAARAFGGGPAAATTAATGSSATNAAPAPEYTPPPPRPAPEYTPPPPRSEPSRSDPPSAKLSYSEVRALVSTLHGSMPMTQLIPILKHTDLPVSPGVGGKSRRTRADIVDDMRSAVGLPALQVPTGLPVDLSLEFEREAGTFHSPDNSSTKPPTLTARVSADTSAATPEPTEDASGAKRESNTSDEVATTHRHHNHKNPNSPHSSGGPLTAALVGAVIGIAVVLAASACAPHVGILPHQLSHSHSAVQPPAIAPPNEQYEQQKALVADIRGPSPRWSCLGVPFLVRWLLCLIFTALCLWPGQATNAVTSHPADSLHTIAYLFAIPLIGILPSLRQRVASLGILPSQVNFIQAMNRMRRVLPLSVALACALSYFFISPPCDTSPADVGLPFGSLDYFTADLTTPSLKVFTSHQAITQLNLPFLGKWEPTASKSGETISFDATSPHSALFCADEAAEAKGKSISLPVICATPDSGCTANVTPKCSRLTDTSPCDEVFGGANGQVARCSVIGSMPVITRTSDGDLVQFEFTNVRCVPDFKYTLLSVTQLWKEQMIDARFADLNHLQLPESAGGVTIPYDTTRALSTVVLVSAAELKHRKASSSQEDTSPPVQHLNLLSLHATDSTKSSALAAIGFYGIKSISHIAKLPASVAGELMHRRTHLAVDKIRALPHVTRDAPRNLSSSSKSACVHCAASQIRRASHSSTLATPTPEPGVLHFDLKEIKLSRGNVRYVAFYIDEHTRFVWAVFLKSKSEVISATKRVIASFNAQVGTPLNPDGSLQARPAVRRLHSDHEGQLESVGFLDFRSNASIDASMSPPHDHNLNPIAERTIGVITTLASAFKAQGNIPDTFIPSVIQHAVNVHNASASHSVGSSTSDPAISPYQRFTLKQPEIMDLAPPGVRAVVLKPPTDQRKPELATRGYVGCLLGRSTKSIGAWDVWVPGANKVVTSSSVTVDEETYPWRRSDSSQPLPAATQIHLASEPSTVVDPSLPSTSLEPKAPLTPQSSHLHFFCLYSGPYSAPGNLASRILQFGWSSAEQFDNHPKLGGGWAHDILNDSTFARLLREAESGAWHGLMIAEDCSTYSPARFFDASDANHDRGPKPVRTREFPDGLPQDQLTASQRHEVRISNLRLNRTVDVAIASYKSSARTTIIFENPADYSDPNTLQYSADLANHGSIFSTSAFSRLRASIPQSSMCTFAACRLGCEARKYTTLFYTNDASAVLNQLSGPDFKCNHPGGAHAARAGGRNPDGSWASARFAAYTPDFNTRLAMAFTYARTGDPRPLPFQNPSPAALLPPAEPPAAALPPPRLPPPPAPPTLEPSSGGGRFSAATSGPPPTSGPLFPDTPSEAPSSPSSSPSPPQPSHSRSVRSSTRSSTHASNARALGSKWENHVTLSPIAEQRATEDDPDAPYTSFTGSPIAPHGTHSDADLLSALAATKLGESTCADVMEAGAFEVAAGKPLVPVGDWLNVSLKVAAAAVSSSSATRASRSEWRVLANVALACAPPKTFHTALRADSAGAPETHAEAAAWGDPWPNAERKELENHRVNGSWERVPASAKPRGRRVHKLVWVFKLKRDGTAKARLCVQGCTLESGVDYDQTFSSTLRYSSARALFAFAAQRGAQVRSIDYVAAYLQGEFIEGEFIYCSAPPGYEEYDADGNPYLYKVVKPIYGIPQAGRRLQRRVFPWMINKAGLRQLDDSDGCVFVYDDPVGSETLVVGIYVDNLQIVHSSPVDSEGEAIDKNSKYSSFIDQLRQDWDVVDEGPMLDLLAIQVRSNGDGSITLHQEDYVGKLLSKYLPDGPPSRFQSNSLPYSDKLLANVIDALDGSTVDSPSHPQLVKSMQERLGALLYLATSTRADLAFVVPLLCRAMSRPTPALMDETDRVFAYLARHPAVGLTYTRSPSSLSGFSDASWEVRQSTSGWVVNWQGCAIAWGSRKQNCVALSSCEAEIIALSEASKDLVYFRKLLAGLDQSFLSGPSSLATDNTGARDLSYNPEHHNKTKHVARRHFFVRDMVEKFEISVPFVRTADNMADFFTKPLSSKSFFAFRKVIMNEPMPGSAG